VSGLATGTYKETDLDVGQGFKNFYEETKFLAEVDVMKSGLPTTVYRPGVVVGDSRRGDREVRRAVLHDRGDGEAAVAGFFLRIGSGRTLVNIVPSTT